MRMPSSLSQKASSEFPSPAFFLKLDGNWDDPEGAHFK